MMEALMQLLSMGNNPQQILQKIVPTDPRAQAIINQMQQTNMNPQQFVEQYAKQNNINLKPFIDFMKSRGIKL